MGLMSYAGAVRTAWRRNIDRDFHERLHAADWNIGNIPVDGWKK